VSADNNNSPYNPFNDADKEYESGTTGDQQYSATNMPSSSEQPYNSSYD